MSIIRNALSSAFLIFASLRADSSLCALLLLFWFGEVPVVEFGEMPGLGGEVPGEMPGLGVGPFSLEQSFPF